MKKPSALALTLVLLSAGSMHGAEAGEKAQGRASGIGGLMIGALGRSIGTLVSAGIGALLGNGKALRSSNDEPTADAGLGGGEHLYREAAILAEAGGGYR